MKLLIAIVSKSDVSQVTEAMTRGGYPSTVTDGMGGFLKADVSIILSGVEEKRINHVLEIISENTRSRESAVPEGMVPATGYTLPDRIRVGGASVFILNVDRFVKL